MRSPAGVGREMQADQVDLVWPATLGRQPDAAERLFHAADTPAARRSTVAASPIHTGARLRPPVPRLAGAMVVEEGREVETARVMEGAGRVVVAVAVVDVVATVPPVTWSDAETPTLPPEQRMPMLYDPAGVEEGTTTPTVKSPVAFRGA